MIKTENKFKFGNIDAYKDLFGRSRGALPRIIDITSIVGCH